jgi:starvation-inducible DNA-binding protein
MKNNLNAIGLNMEESRKLADSLNHLLANYQIFYMNTRGFHWNITGSKFFELHLKFEELYTSALLKIDELAERILTLGESPVHSFSDYLKTAKIGEAKHISNGPEAIQNVLDSFKTLLELEREILELSASAGDEGTNALMSDYIREKEKLVWMYSAFLKS